MGYLLASLFDGALVWTQRKIGLRWGWRSFGVCFATLIALWILLLVTR